MTDTCKLGKNGCFNDGRCRFRGECENKIITNDDYINSMTAKEKAKIFADTFLCGYGAALIEEWLQQPVGEG